MTKAAQKKETLSSDVRNDIYVSCRDTYVSKLQQHQSLMRTIFFYCKGVPAGKGGIMEKYVYSRYKKKIKVNT